MIGVITSLIGKAALRFGGLPVLTVGMALVLSVGTVAGWKAHNAIYGKAQEKVAERASEAATGELADRRETITVYQEVIKYKDRYIQDEGNSQCFDGVDIDLVNEWVRDIQGAS